MYCVIVRHCGLVGSAPAWDGTDCEFDSWQCRMFTEPTITWVPSGFSGYILWLDTKIVFKKPIRLPEIMRNDIWSHTFWWTLLAVCCGDMQSPSIYSSSTHSFPYIPWHHLMHLCNSFTAPAILFICSVGIVCPVGISSSVIIQVYYILFAILYTVLLYFRISHASI